MSQSPRRAGGGRMRTARMRRVDEAMRAVLSEAIAMGLKDPRIGFVTVTGVKTSPDLRHAQVYVSVLGSELERADSLRGLHSAHGYLQRRLADELTLKHTPSLSFHYDESVDHGMRISALVSELERSGDPSSPQGDAPPAPNDGGDDRPGLQPRDDGDDDR
jgi:ribosome-binding factor A